MRSTSSFDLSYQVDTYQTICICITLLNTPQSNIKSNKNQNDVCNKDQRLRHVPYAYCSSSHRVIYEGHFDLHPFRFTCFLLLTLAIWKFPLHKIYCVLLCLKSSVRSTQLEICWNVIDTTADEVGGRGCKW